MLPGAETSDHRICWRFTHVDHEGPWGFDKVEPETLRWLFDRLGQLETMTVNEIFNRGDYPGKDYDVETIPNVEALDRLEQIGLADMTKIWCLRLQGEPRLYGFLHGHVFHIVWWDPKHEIWPSRLKHT
ncbi:hypothetical protein SAMN04489712_1158 [Thermomonospora echinospora]|uniref:Uncharacterized protein n=1 Tax=Thermomonospora echinospora TaxID=1992 RepID=A0A1H6DCA8_9ACTN|nr:hypothetical protein SAMN04489712_1158 [Thermomonospora echinospora]